jgi:hypothetical protein
MSADKEDRNAAIRKNLSLKGTIPGTISFFRTLLRSNVGMLQQSVTFSPPSHTCHCRRNEAPSLNCSLIMPRIGAAGPAATVSIEFH